MDRPLNVESLRLQFPALLRQHAGQRAVFFDGPAGSQVPQRVADAVSDYLLFHNGNHGGPFATSLETDALCNDARAAFADFVGGAEHEIVFGPNMTTLTFHLSRALAKTWRQGDEILVTDSDHDANVMPWVLAARDAGVTVHRIAVSADTTLDLADFERKLSTRTRLVAVGAASNLSGTIHPIAQIAARARQFGALTFVDAVHYAPHARVDVQALGCDFLVCSAYKFYGPHLGVLWGKGALLEQLDAYKVRTSPSEGPEKWQTGTANFEAIAGGLAAIGYLADIGHELGLATRDRRQLLDAAFAATFAHEQTLCARLLAGLTAIDSVRVIGLPVIDRQKQRCSTVSFVHRELSPRDICLGLAARGVFCWAGNNYALALSRALGLEPLGVLRVGMLNYNTAGEVDYFLASLGEVLVK
jgi:cysteine desulfurase family protein (TIGR01976 family)